MFITGATGAGKSTVSPFLLVYAIKILNYNNNGKVVCTQPRKQPTKDNAVQISKNIGYVIEYDDTKKVINKNINYIQYKYSDEELTDDFYHPCLRLYTDGSLYQIIKSKSMSKN
jgi:energy-coupling factor transporter ATP-binding protein EcfA2